LVAGAFVGASKGDMETVGGAVGLSLRVLCSDWRALSIDWAIAGSVSFGCAKRPSVFVWATNWFTFGVQGADEWAELVIKALVVSLRVIGSDWRAFSLEWAFVEPDAFGGFKRQSVDVHSAKWFAVTVTVANRRTEIVIYAHVLSFHIVGSYWRAIRFCSAFVGAVGV
jgi:hypothetical protein